MLDGLFVEGVDLRRFGFSMCGDDFLSHCLNIAYFAASQKHSRTCPCDGYGDGAANRPASTVNHSNFVFQQHGLVSFQSRLPVLNFSSLPAAITVLAGLWIRRTCEGTHGAGTVNIGILTQFQP